MPETGPVRTLGIDLASQAEKTATCIVEWGTGTAKVLEVRCHATDDDLDKLIRNDEIARIGIDVPFGWPDPFINALKVHQHCESWADPLQDFRPREISDLVDLLPRRKLNATQQRREVERIALTFRRTDHVVRRKTNHWPLSVAATYLGITTLRAAALLFRHSECGRPLDRRGIGRVVEVYPRAALAVWNCPADDLKRYKKNCECPRDRKNCDCAGDCGCGPCGSRSSLLRNLIDRAGLTVCGADLRVCTKRHDPLDALVAALVARAVDRKLGEPPPDLNDEITRREGWIWLPTAENSLRLLVDPAADA